MVEPSEQMMDLINHLASIERDLQTEIVYHDIKQNYLFVVAERLENGERWIEYSSGHFVKAE